jgi:hypothetical protein
MLSEVLVEFADEYSHISTRSSAPRKPKFTFEIDFFRSREVALLQGSTLARNAPSSKRNSGGTLNFELIWSCDPIPYPQDPHINFTVPSRQHAVHAPAG